MPDCEEGSRMTDIERMNAKLIYRFTKYIYLHKEPDQ